MATKLAIEPGVLGSVSDERDTEWKEDMEEAGACPETEIFLGREGSTLSGGYVCTEPGGCGGWSDALSLLDVKVAEDASDLRE